MFSRALLSEEEAAKSEQVLLCSTLLLLCFHLVLFALSLLLLDGRFGRWFISLYSFGCVHFPAGYGISLFLWESGADSLPLPQLGLQVHCHAQ
jgi:hypothetical protein